MPRPEPSYAERPRPAVEQLVASITAEVLRQLAVGRPIPGVPPLAASAPAEAAPAAPSSDPSVTPRAEKVITLATVTKLPRETREVILRADAVVTPSARELLHDRGILVRRATAAAAVATVPSPSFLVATAESGRTVGDAAAIARAVPAAQQLPSLGVEALVDAFAEATLRGGSRGLLLSSRPAAVVVIANRTKAIRAVTARSVREALDAAAECRATLLVVDPRQIAGGGLRRLAVEFAKQVHDDLPADLERACRPCGCSHPAQEARA